MKKVCDLIHQSPAVYERSLKVLVQCWVTGGDIDKECVDVSLNLNILFIFIAVLFMDTFNLVYVAKYF